MKTKIEEWEVIEFINRDGYTVAARKPHPVA
jgi:hypothetical protein